MAKRRRTAQEPEWQYDICDEPFDGWVEGTTFVWILTGIWWGWGVADLVRTATLNRIPRGDWIMTYIGPDA